MLICLWCVMGCLVEEGIIENIKHCTSISGINNSYLACDIDGYLYGCGDNGQSELGLKKRQYNIFEKIETISINGELAPSENNFFVSCQVLISHSLVYDKQGNVWVSGCSEVFEDSTKYFTMIPELKCAQ